MLVEEESVKDTHATALMHGSLTEVFFFIIFIIIK